MMTGAELQSLCVSWFARLQHAAASQHWFARVRCERTFVGMYLSQQSESWRYVVCDRLRKFSVHLARV
jgi:hypothetical protein